MIAPSLARRLQDIAPGVRIAWTQLNRGAISTELASGRLDLAIDVPGIRGTDLEREPLMTTPYVCVVSEDHPLSGRQMTFETFLELRHVVVSSRREGRSYVEEVARSHGARITPVMRLPTYMPALEIVKYTDLALTAPALLAQSPGLVSHDLPGVFPALDSELYWRRENSEDAALTWLRALILDAVTELAG